MIRFGIIDYHAGNLRNVEKALQILGHQTEIVSSPVGLQNADALVLPGVGSFYAGMTNLKSNDLVSAIRDQVLAEKKPFLGICLGMQLMAEEGDEGGQSEGLGLIPGHIEKMNTGDRSFRLPHIGWDDVAIIDTPDMFATIPNSTDFYFVHSYHFVVKKATAVSGLCRYGTTFNAAIQSQHIGGT